MTTTKKVVASKSSEIILGTAAARMVKAVDELKGVITSIADLTEKSEDLQSVIADREQKIDDLEVQFKEKERAAKVEFDVMLKEHQLNGASTTAAKFNKILIDKTEYNNLVKELEDIKTDMQAKISREVGVRIASAESNHKNEMNLAKAQNEATNAKVLAQLETANQTIKSLESQVLMWKTQLESERTASIERAKASAVGQLVVNGNK